MDLTKIRERLAQLNQGSTQKKHIWKPSPGDTTIRIVPYSHTPDWPFLELFFHYNITKKQVLSPVTFGEADPIEEFASELRSSGQTDDYFLARKLSPAMRTYVPILVRGKESEGPKFWGFGKTTYEQLLKFIDDPDWGDITSLTDGRDIVVSYEKAVGENDFASTTIRPKPNITVASKDKSVLESLQNMPKIEDLWPMGNYNELKIALERYLNNLVESSDETSAEESHTNEEPSSEKTKVPSLQKNPPKSDGYTNKDTLDDEFAKILDSKPSDTNTTSTEKIKTTPKATPNPEEAFDELFR